MSFLAKINPATYGITPIRQVMLGAAPDSPFAINVLGHTMSVWDKVIHALPQPNLSQYFFRRPPMRYQLGGKLNILPGREGGNQVEELEDESNLGATEAGELTRRELCDVNAVDYNPP